MGMFDWSECWSAKVRAVHSVNPQGARSTGDCLSAHEDVDGPSIEERDHVGNQSGEKKQLPNLVSSIRYECLINREISLCDQKAVRTLDRAVCILPPVCQTR
jgi:hypothetical protein